MRRAIVSTAVLAVLGAGSLLPAAHASDDACDWPMYGRDLGHSFNAPAECTTLSALTAPSITPRWGMTTPDSLTASPTVVDGVAYAGDWTGHFYAIPVDQAGIAEPSWTFEIDDPNAVAFGRIVSSASVTTIDDIKVVIFGGGATLYVLDAGTGRELTRLCLDPRRDAHTTGGRCKGTQPGQQVEIESSPAVIAADTSAQVVVGLDVHNDQDVGRTGIVSSTLAHDAGAWTFVPDWKFDPEGDGVGDANGATYTDTPGDGDSYDLLTKGSASGWGCASVWGSPAIDTDNSLVFFGTGSCGASGIEVGEDAWALDLASGALVWRFDTPRVNEDWDDDYGASPNLLPDDLVGFGSKDGTYYAFDRRNPDAPDDDPYAASVAWTTRVGESGHVTDGFAVGGIIGTPAVGTVGGLPAVFATTALSTPIYEPLNEGHPDKWLDTSLAEDPFRMLSLSAIDAATGDILWRTPISRQSYGAPTFSNGVVLVPSTFSAELLAFQADTGVLLSVMPVFGASSSSPTVVGDTIYLGSGTRTSDLEFKAFGADALSPYLGVSPISYASGLFAYKILAPDVAPVPTAPRLPVAPFGPLLP